MLRPTMHVADRVIRRSDHPMRPTFAAVILIKKRVPPPPPPPIIPRTTHIPREMTLGSTPGRLRSVEYRLRHGASQSSLVRYEASLRPPPCRKFETKESLERAQHHKLKPLRLFRLSSIPVSWNSLPPSSPSSQLQPDSTTLNL